MFQNISCYIQKNQNYKFNTLKLYLKPSKKNLFFFKLKTKRIIQSRKGIKIFQIIFLLRPLLTNWGKFYKSLQSTTSLKNIDFFFFNEYRRWVKVRRSVRKKRILNLKTITTSKKNGNWGVSSSNTSCKNKKKHLFFPENRKWFFLDRFYKDKWVFFSLRKKTKFFSLKKPRIQKQVSNKRGGKYIESFLPKIEWVLSAKHKMLSNYRNLFDGNLIFWKSRFLPKKREESL